MGRPKIFAITLDGNNPVYFAGSTIEGNVILELSQPKVMQGISIVLSGLTYVHWTEERHRGTRETGRIEIVHYSDSETILNRMSTHLWGNGKDSQELAAGRYEFPFKYQLPYNVALPTSFESQYGYIRYTLTATILRSWKHNHTTKRAITINETVDINTPYLTAPLSGSNEKTLCCLCCASGPISLSVTIDRAGYCPGESIAISTEAENHSNRRVAVVQASLIQIVVYFACGHSRTSSRIVQRIQGPGIEEGDMSNWHNELLPIPATVPSIGSCRILKLSYVLQVTLALPRAIDLNVILRPITIGNVPFKGDEAAANSCWYPLIRNPPAQTYVPPPYPPKPLTETAPSPVPVMLTYSAAHPPVYIGDDNYTMGETQYAPVYGFVTNYQFAPPLSYSEAVTKVMSGEEM
ncbi:arrestin domain-containing protein 3-like [Dysidea avara]|uniref:arrestin domain-containing protein 3-like n=1 Tax=Dysidea avara TaxID=196820 RepID=UPI00332D4A82